MSHSSDWYSTVDGNQKNVGKKNKKEATAEHKNQEWLEQVVVFAAGQRGFQSPFSQTLRAHILLLSISGIGSRL